MMSALNKALPNGAAEDMVQNLLNQIRSSKEDSVTSPMAPASSDVARSSSGIPCNTLPTVAAQSDNACGIVMQWLSANTAEDVNMHPAFSRMVRTLKKCVCTCPQQTLTCPSHVRSAESLTLEDLFFHIANCVYECVPEMVPTVALGANMILELITSSPADATPSFPETMSFLMTNKDCQTRLFRLIDW